MKDKQQQPPQPDPFAHLPQWECELEAASEPPVNVGSQFKMHCVGDYIAPPDKEKLVIQFKEKAQKYSLQLLEVKNFESESADFVVTSYKPGQFSGLEVAFVEGKVGFRTQIKDLVVESVIDPQKPPEKPYPSFGPFQLGMPVWYWAGIAIVVVAIVTAVTLWVRKIIERKKIVEELASHATALPPIQQFHKDQRVLLRKFQNRNLSEKYREEFSEQELVTQLDQIWRQYLMRELLVPAMKWGDGAIISEIKKRHKKVYSESDRELKKVFRELRQALKNKDKLSVQDCEQIAMMIRKTAERIHKIKGVR